MNSKPCKNCYEEKIFENCEFLYLTGKDDNEKITPEEKLKATATGNLISILKDKHKNKKFNNMKPNEILGTSFKPINFDKEVKLKRIVFINCYFECKCGN